MDVLETYSQITGLFESPAFSFTLTLVIIYIGILWIAVIIWIARDIVHRSDNLLFQVISILLGFTFIPGLILYLIIRPTRTLAEKYDEELERRAFLESIVETDEECPTCKMQLNRDFIYCPNCRTQLKKVCKCGQILEKDWQVCPHCGKLTKEEKNAPVKKAAPKSPTKK